MPRGCARHCGVRIGVCTLLVGAALSAISSHAFAESLAEVLARYQVEAARLPSGHVPERPITSYAVFADRAFVAIAYYEDNGTGILEPPLNVFDETTIGADNRHCFGSVVTGRVSSNGAWFTTHLTPSASCTLILSPGLALREVLYGWPVGMFADGTVIYQHSQVHFAPTHSAELSVYEPGSGASRRIYPLRPFQRIRQEHVSRHRIVYDDPDWCNRRNHHCDPELFDSAITFVASFSNRELASPGQQPDAATEVLYVYRNLLDPSRIEYREMLLSEFRSRYGETADTTVAVSPQVLSQIFGD
jgi:hypothetical protein